MAGDWVTTGSTTRTFRQTSTDRIQAQFWTPTLTDRASGRSGRRFKSCQPDHIRLVNAVRVAKKAVAHMLRGLSRCSVTG
jgi:hypothetical protein